VAKTARREPIEIVVADKSPLVTSALRQLFAKDDRFRLVATASDGERFLEAVRRMKFDVGIIGWDMPYCDGRRVLEVLRKQAGVPRILVYTGNLDPDVPREVMALGGAGFCAKSDPPERLLAAVDAIAGGRMVFPFVDVRTLGADPLASLTLRERELLKRLATGRTNAQLAKDIGVSVNTVKFHLKNLYEKLDVRNRAQAVALLAKRGAAATLTGRN
jgi:two-component system, NarL family, nitrate/nitrite response regulator NarL